MAIQTNGRAFILAMMLAGCAELRAEAPLFSPTDQIGPPPLTEGIWIAVHEDCPASNLRRRGRFPSECTPLEIRRLSDGAWQVRMRVDLVSNLSREERASAESDAAPLRVVIAPATEHPSPEAFAPLYVVERNPTSEDQRIGYTVVAPLGPMPATEALILSSIGCTDILRDGPIEGVAPQYSTRVGENGEEVQDLVGCTASTQAAVREAARRALIENVDELMDRRYVHVRP